jgi:hypothetical protein
MSYETTNYLPKRVSKRHAIEFAELLGYCRQGTYAHLGSPETASLIYYEAKDYKSWMPVELSIGISAERGAPTSTRELVSAAAIMISRCRTGPSANFADALVDRPSRMAEMATAMTLAHQCRQQRPDAISQCRDSIGISLG